MSRGVCVVYVCTYTRTRARIYIIYTCTYIPVEECVKYKQFLKMMRKISVPVLIDYANHVQIEFRCNVIS